MSTAEEESSESAARRLDAIAPGYLEQVRRAAKERAVPPTPRARVRRAIELLDETSRIDSRPPIESNLPGGAPVKAVIAKLIRWYVAHLAGQVTDLGDSVSWLGRALEEYVGSLEAELRDLRVQVEELKASMDARQGGGV